MYIEEIPKKLSNTSLLVLFVVVLYREVHVDDIIAIVSAVANENKQVVSRAITKLVGDGYFKYNSRSSTSFLKSGMIFSHSVFVKLYKLMREKFGLYYFASKARELKGSEFADLTKLCLQEKNTSADFVIYVLARSEQSDLILPSNFCTKNAKSLECMREAAYIVATSIKDVDFSGYETIDGCYNFVLLYLNVSFLLGNDFRKSLLSIPLSYVKDDDDLLSMCMVLATWIGDVDYFSELTKYATAKTLNINFACIRIFKGDIAAADKFFKRYEKENVSGLRSSNKEFDNFPERFLCALTFAVAKEGKLAKSPPCRCVEGHDLQGRIRVSKSCDERTGYCSLESGMSQAFCTGWAALPGNVVDAITTISGKNDKMTFQSLFKACDIYSKHLNNENKVFLDDVLSDIRSWMAKGYILYASLLAALISGAMSLPDDVQEMMKSSNVKLLRAMEYQPEWAHTLHALEDVAKKIKVDNEEVMPLAKPKRFYWFVTFNERPEYDSSMFDTPVLHLFCELWRVGIVLFDDDKDDNFVSPTLYDRKKDFASDDILQYCDREDLMVISRIIASFDGYYDDFHFTASDRAMILKHLSKKDNVVLREADYSYTPLSYNNRYKFSRIKIKVDEVEMSASYDDRGQLSLSLPQWIFSASQGEVILKTGDNEYTQYQIARRVKDVVAVFKEHGQNGKIVFPEEALDKVMPCAMKIENVLPVAPPKEEDVANLRREEGSSIVTLRMSYHGNTIGITAVVVPVSHLKGLAFLPGEGAAERVLHNVAGPYLLVRNIEREQANFELVKDAIVSCNCCETVATNEWKITDILSGIDVVNRLKALKDVAILEWLQNEIKLTISSQTSFRQKSGNTVDEWFGIQGDFELDDGRIIGITEMLSAMKCHNENYIRIGECEFLQITKRLMRELSILESVAHKHKGGGIEFSNAAIPALTDVLDSEKSIIKLPEKIKCEAEKIRNAFDGTPEIPEGLNATLRNYQKQGFVWLSRIASAGLGSCLADDMGLGKTIQIISVLLERSLDGASLVVAPSSVTVNWISEIKRFAPSLAPVFAQQNGDYLESLAEHNAAEDEKNVVVVVSYGYLVFHEKTFSKIKWNGVVLDEAQAIKNASSQRAKIAKDIPAKFRIAATGTPIENRLGELWSIFDFLNPGLLGPASDFMERFSKNGVATSSLKKLVRPLILRRLKENVLKDLPQKTEIVLPVELGNDERHAYEACRIHALQRLGGLIEGSEDVNRICVLAELTRLRRFCCHPELVMKGQKLPSAKMEALLDLLDELKEGGHRALIFSQFTEYLAIVTKEIASHGFSYLYLDGSTPTAERGDLVKTFQKGETDFFVISLKAGGTGLNLTAADYVIILDPWWNPAVENQAADRAHRIGQRRPVTVYRLIAKDTVEERVMSLHDEKLAIAEDVLDGTSSSKLSSEKLLSLFK